LYAQQSWDLKGRGFSRAVNLSGSVTGRRDFHHPTLGALSLLPAPSLQ